MFHPQQYDLTSKDLFKDIDRGLVRWLTGKEPSDLQWLDASFPTVGELKADLVFQAVLEGQTWIFHLELQSSNDSAMAYRMLRYWSHIHQTYQKPVYQSVLYMGSAPVNMESSLVQKQASEVGLEYHISLDRFEQSERRGIIGIKRASLFVSFALEWHGQRANRARIRSLCGLFVRTYPGCGYRTKAQYIAANRDIERLAI